MAASAGREATVFRDSVEASVCRQYTGCPAEGSLGTPGEQYECTVNIGDILRRPTHSCSRRRCCPSDHALEDTHRHTATTAKAPPGTVTASIYNGRRTVDSVAVLTAYPPRQAYKRIPIFIFSRVLCRNFALAPDMDWVTLGQCKAADSDGLIVPPKHWSGRVFVRQ